MQDHAAHDSEDEGNEPGDAPQLMPTRHNRNLCGLRWRLRVDVGTRERCGHEIPSVRFPLYRVDTPLRLAVRPGDQGIGPERHRALGGGPFAQFTVVGDHDHPRRRSPDLVDDGIVGGLILGEADLDTDVGGE